MSNKKKCSHCGGKVHLSVQRSTIEHPARDHRGHFIYELRTDHETGKQIEKQVMVKYPIRGLGTWHCEQGCKDVRVQAA